MGSRAGLEGWKIRPHRDSIPDRPARSSVAMPTELRGPHLSYYICNKNQQNTHFSINDFIQLFFLRRVSNNQVFIIRKICACSFMVVSRASV